MKNSDKFSHVNVNEQGFSLLEVMISLAIISIGILAIASMQVASTKVNASVRQSTEGSTWAVDRVEQLMSLPYDDTQLSTGSYATTSPDGVYAINWTVADSVVIPKTKSISTNVTWTRGTTTKNMTINKIIPEIF